MPRDDYEERQEARRARLEERADKAAAEASARFTAAHQAVAGIPLGQPVLVGHYSESRHRAAIDRMAVNMNKGCAAAEQAKALERRAAAVGEGGISSDDPSAIDKLRAKLGAEQAEREARKRINAAYRKGGWEAVAELDVPAALVELGHTTLRVSPCEGVPFPPYSLNNLGANIRRIEARIAQLEREAARPASEATEGDGWRIEERPDINRIAITFAGVPPEDVRAQLKASGWRWSRNEGAWLRFLNPAGRASARHLATLLAPAPAAAPARCACWEGRHCDQAHLLEDCGCGRCQPVQLDLL